MRRLLVVLALVAVATPAAANTIIIPLALAKLGQTTVREVNVALPSGRTLLVRVFSTPDQRKQADDFITKLEAPKRTALRDIEYGRYAGPDDASSDGGQSFALAALDVACGMIGAGAKLQGGLNIWFDAAGAVCSSFAIVDGTRQVINAVVSEAEQIYEGYLVFAEMQHINKTIIVNLGTVHGMPIF